MYSVKKLWEIVVWAANPVAKICWNVPFFKVVNEVDFSELCHFVFRDGYHIHCRCYRRLRIGANLSPALSSE